MLDSKANMFLKGLGTTAEFQKWEDFSGMEMTVSNI